jgi:hypothetical protein
MTALDHPSMVGHGGAAAFSSGLAGDAPLNYTARGG